MKKVVTVPNILRMVDLSILKNRAAENLGKFCKIIFVKCFKCSLSFGDKLFVFLLNVYDVANISSASFRIRSQMAITVAVPSCKNYLQE
jgi:hypothetical protein